MVAFLNIAGLWAMSIVLGIAFYYQLALHELPCPLCLLQRAGFMGVALGLALNLRFGNRPAHYGIMLLSALAGGAVAARQTLLHIMPSDSGFGSAFLGLHFYVWALISYILVVAGVAAMLIFFGEEEPPAWGNAAHVAVAAFALMVLANFASTFLECGTGICPADPVSYQLLSGEKGGE